MPKEKKRKRYSQTYQRRLAQKAVRDVQDYLHAHASNETSHSNNRYSCNSSLSEGYNDRADILSEFAREEIQEIFQNEEVVPETLQEERFSEELIPSDEYVDFSSESEDEDNHVNIDRLRQNLVKWTHRNNICRSAVTELLQVLKIEKAIKSLPTDARTLLKTPRKSETVPMMHGQYVHFDIAEGIRYIIETSGTVTRLPEEIHLSFNIDGLPLTKSSKSQLWPILGCLRNFKNKSAFIIGAFHGYKKPPKAEVFLKYFVEEAERLVENGYTWKDTNSKFIIDCFICDAPGRAYISCIKSHGGYYACGKCKFHCMKPKASSLEKWFIQKRTLRYERRNHLPLNRNHNIILV